MKISGVDTTNIVKINGISKSSITKLSGVTLPSGIVTSGLVMYLDAGVGSSYPGSGTAWTDISYNGNDGTLVNGPTYSSADGGSILFDGTDDNASTLFNGTLNDFTICCWFKATDSSNNPYTRLLDKSFTGGFWLGKDAASPDSWGGGIQEVSPPFGRFLTLTDGQWNFITSVRESTTNTLYGNGIANTTSGTVTSAALDSSYLLLAQYIGGLGYNFKGNIAIVQMYNRALTSSEVLQNYNATKARYGY
jgi:hypothetical protein